MPIQLYVWIHGWYYISAIRLPSKSTTGNNKFSLVSLYGTGTVERVYASTGVLEYY
eukprot:SAG31_NODE_1350_length_8681_cov_14.408879_1_plen_56_part_00